MTIRPAPYESKYTSSVEKCDVEDRAALLEYRAKRSEWLSCYEVREDEPNGIQRQIFNMMFLDMAYRILAEPRRNTNDSKVAAKNGLLAHLLDQGYVATQILAIRKILDPSGDVISIRRLLNDVCQHRQLLSREVYVSYDGLPYDAESWRSLPEDVEKQIWGIRAPGLGKYLSSRTRHETFDRLAGVSPSNRTRADLIQTGVFEKLNRWLDDSGAKKLTKLGNKFITHAADMTSRGSLEYSGVSLADITKVHRAIVRVERAITDELLFIGVGRAVVPMMPLGFLKGLDTPYASPDSIAGMESEWRHLAAERDGWPAGVADEISTLQAG